MYIRMFERGVVGIPFVEQNLFPSGAPHGHGAANTLNSTAKLHHKTNSIIKSLSTTFRMKSYRTRSKLSHTIHGI